MLSLLAVEVVKVSQGKERDALVRVVDNMKVTVCQCKQVSRITGKESELQYKLVLVISTSVLHVHRLI
jgi:hypothetical protein